MQKKKNSLTHTYKFKAVYDKGQMNCKYKNYSTQCKADMALDAPLSCTKSMAKQKYQMNGTISIIITRTSHQLGEEWSEDIKSLWQCLVFIQ